MILIFSQGGECLSQSMCFHSDSQNHAYSPALQVETGLFRLSRKSLTWNDSARSLTIFPPKTHSSPLDQALGNKPNYMLTVGICHLGYHPVSTYFDFPSPSFSSGFCSSPTPRPWPSVRSHLHPSLQGHI